jgi:hypothetical protein
MIWLRKTSCKWIEGWVLVVQGRDSNLVNWSHWWIVRSGGRDVVVSVDVADAECGRGVYTMRRATRIPFLNIHRFRRPSPRSVRSSCLLQHTHRRRSSRRHSPSDPGSSTRPSTEEYRSPFSTTRTVGTLLSISRRLISGDSMTSPTSYLRSSRSLRSQRGKVDSNKTMLCRPKILYQLHCTDWCPSLRET